MKVQVFVMLLLWINSLVSAQSFPTSPPKPFDKEKDLISLHYDHAPDKDDGHSAVADRTLLQSLFGAEWLKHHIIPVSGAYGANKPKFRPESDQVMDAVFNDCGGWLAAHTDRDAALATIFKRWTEALNAGGDVWVKEGGQSDLTGEVLRRINQEFPEITTTERVHVVQHDDTFNEKHSDRELLAYTKEHSDYIRIKNANEYLNMKPGDENFIQAAIAHPVYGNLWKTAFEYMKPTARLDFSDTGELMHILDLGEIDIAEFGRRYLGEEASTQPTTFLPQNTKIAFDERNYLYFEDVGRSQVSDGASTTQHTRFGRFVRLHCHREGKEQAIDLVDTNFNKDDPRHLIINPEVKKIEYRDKEHIWVISRGGHLGDSALLFNIVDQKSLLLLGGTGFTLSDDKCKIAYIKRYNIYKENPGFAIFVNKTMVYPQVSKNLTFAWGDEPKDASGRTYVELAERSGIIKSNPSGSIRWLKNDTIQFESLEFSSISQDAEPKAVSYEISGIDTDADGNVTGEILSRNDDRDSK